MNKDKKYIPYLTEDPLPKPLSDEEFKRLISLAKSDTRVRNYIVERNIRLVFYYVSRKYCNIPNVDMGELMSIALLSLVLAVDNFDLLANNGLATYAIATMEHNINKYLKKENRSILGPLHPSSSQMEIITNPEDTILREEESNIIINLVDTLPPDIKEVIKMKYGFYDKVYSNIEISKIMNTSTNTVVSRANKGLKIIKDILIKTNIYEENSGLKPVTLKKTLYDYFKEVPKEKLREALTILTPFELSTLDKIFTMKEINYRPRRKIINKDLIAVENTIIPKIKTILKEK